jgi:hypothetical protein
MELSDLIIQYLRAGKLIEKYQRKRPKQSLLTIPLITLQIIN